MTNATAMLSALGDPTRQAILDKLTHGPLAVGQLADVLPVSRPAVSQHLKVLKEVGLVTDRQEGTRRLYQADPEALAVLRAHLDAFWERSLAAFQDRTTEDRATEGRVTEGRAARGKDETGEAHDRDR